MNGTHDGCIDSAIKEPSPSRSPNNRFDNQPKKNGSIENKGNFVNCDICEKRDFSNESELIAHKKLFHHKLLSPGKVILV